MATVQMLGVKQQIVFQRKAPKALFLLDNINLGPH